MNDERRVGVKRARNHTQRLQRIPRVVLHIEADFDNARDAVTTPETFGEPAAIERQRNRREHGPILLDLLDERLFRRAIRTNGWRQK